MAIDDAQQIKDGSLNPILIFIPDTTMSDHNSTTPSNNSVIFIHPDGTTPSHYALARYETAGPDGRINWDQMDSAGSYLSHVKDQLTATSNAGAVVHAYGVKPQADSYGLDEEGNPIASLSAQESLTDIENRNQTEEITAEVLESGVDVILGGGETDYLPEGTTGFFSEEGTRTDGRIKEAEEMGYTVIYTREQLHNLPEDATKVLGIFAAEYPTTTLPKKPTPKQD